MTDKNILKKYHYDDWDINGKIKKEKEREPVPWEPFICDYCKNAITKEMYFCPQCGTELKPQDNVLLTELKNGITEYKKGFNLHIEDFHRLFHEYTEQTTAQLNHTHEEMIKCLKAKFPANQRRYTWSFYSILGLIVAFLVFAHGINLIENNEEWGGIYSLIGLLMSIPWLFCYEAFKYQCQWCHEFSNNERRINHDINCIHVRF